MNEATRRKSETGAALITALMLLAFLSSLLAAHYFLTWVELSTTQASMDGTRGFYAAEAGLNLRAEKIRQEFVGFNRPAGATPVVTAGQVPCTGGDLGSGHFRCESLFLENQDVFTYVDEQPGNPTLIVIPPGEPFQNVTAQEYTYYVHSVAKSSRDTRPEAILEMHFRSRLVPLFQFAAFYDKDLEILPGPSMSFEGPVHSNRDLYLDAGDSLTIDSSVSAVGKLYRGRKDKDICSGHPVEVYDPVSPRELPACIKRVEVTGADVVPWNGAIRLGLDPVTVPPPESLDPTPGETYWDRADLRIILNLNKAGGTVEVRDAIGNDLGLGLCGAVTASDTFLNRREGTTIEMLEVDLEKLFDCIDDVPATMGGKLLDDSTDGGLVWYLGVEGPTPTGTPNNYGVRLKEGSDLASTHALAPEVQGLTIVTNQAIYIQGDYNSASWKPAAILADSLNVLSNAWDDVWNAPTTPLPNRDAANTAIYAAFLAGTDSTGDAEGAGGQDNHDYNGGLENYPRFHEDWGGARLTYRGSFVSLDTPRHAQGPWDTPNVYNPPIRDWGYDMRFNDAAKLPPLSPRFVYLRQDLFVRGFEL